MTKFSTEVMSEILKTTFSKMEQQSSYLLLLFSHFQKLLASDFQNYEIKPITSNCMYAYVLYMT